MLGTEGGSSQAAVYLIDQFGFTNVSVLKGSFKGWQDAGYPLVGTSIKSDNVT
jgi:rhodanese-related sulfurtransferase